MQTILPDAAEHGCEGEDGGHAHSYEGKKIGIPLVFLHFWNTF